MHRMFLIASAVIAVLCGVAGAEEHTRLAASGSWALYRVKDYAVALGGDHGEIREACVAETGNDKARLAFIMFSASDPARAPAASGAVFGQVTVPSWQFRVRTADFTLEDANVSLVIAGTLYDDDMIMFNMGDNGQVDPDLQAIIEAFEGPLTLSDHRGRKLATFPSNGLRAMYRKMLACGGA